MFEMTSSWGISDEQAGGWRKGPWTPEEDKLLVEYVSRHGEGRWSCASKYASLNRSGKSCRLRWVNYLRPGLKKGHMTPQEEGIIIELHALWGNKWSTIARYLPGRTDNEIKNYWRTHFKKRKPSNPNRRSSTKLQTRKDDDHDSKNVVIKEIPNHHHHHHEEMGEATTSDAKKGKEAMVSEHPSIIETVHPMTIYDHNDFVVPIDYNYLWGGLWNLDDQNCSSKMGIQIYNEANNHVLASNCSRVGDQLVYYT